MERITGLTLFWLVAMTSCVPHEGTEIGPRGGTVMSEDGRFMLEIPAGALEQAVEITLEEVACRRPESVGACYELGPVGLPLTVPGTVTYELDSEQLDGVDVEQLVLLTEREGHWSGLADHEIDPHRETVSGSAVYLGVYALAVSE